MPKLKPVLMRERPAWAPTSMRGSRAAAATGCATRSRTRTRSLPQPSPQADLRGMGGAGFPTHRKWAHDRGAQGRRQVRHLQRQRGRARHVQGPLPAGAHAASGDRGRADRGGRPRAPTTSCSTSIPHERRAVAVDPARPSSNGSRSSAARRHRPRASAARCRSRSWRARASTSAARRRP